MPGSLRGILVEVSDGNVRNHHVYLREALGFFPKDCVGGSNKSEAASPISLELGQERVETDIDGDKAIFRDRGSIRRFFELERVSGGDVLFIERLGERSYRISKPAKRVLNHYL